MAQPAPRTLLECIADTRVAPGLAAPAGRDFRLPAGKGWILLRFRAAAIEGWRIRRADLLVHGSRLRGARAQVRLVRRPWLETEATWAHPAEGEVWNLAGAQTLRCPPKTISCFYVFVPGEAGWSRLELPGWYAEALARGDAFGLALRLPRGVMDSRETVAYAPYLLVEGAETGHHPRSARPE
jgi:hypothetical protein